MKNILEKLPSATFARVHRSYIINKSKIKELTKGSITLVYGDVKKEIPIGEQYKDDIVAQLY